MESSNYLKRREAVHSGRDKELFLDIGYFVACFSTVELVITLILAGLTNSEDVASFEALVRGMDLRVKIERLKQLSQMRVGMGPQLRARLKILEEVVCKLRNGLIHGSLAIAEDDGPLRYYYFSVADMPWRQLGLKSGLGESNPREVTSEYLFKCAEWLDKLRDDLAVVVQQTKHHGILELENPSSSPRMEAPANLRRKVSPSKLDKQAQKSLDQKPKG
jgi:hypothetical protein